MSDVYQSSVSAKLEVPDDGLSAAGLSAWLEHIPPGAKITVQMQQRGDQRDPYEVLKAVHARWEAPL